MFHALKIYRSTSGGLSVSGPFDANVRNLYIQDAATHYLNVDNRGSVIPAFDQVVTATTTTNRNGHLINYRDRSGGSSLIVKSFWWYNKQCEPIYGTTANSSGGDLFHVTADETGNAYIYIDSVLNDPVASDGNSSPDPEVNAVPVPIAAARGWFCDKNEDDQTKMAVI